MTVVSLIYTKTKIETSPQNLGDDSSKLNLHKNKKETSPQNLEDDGSKLNQRARKILEKYLCNYR